MKKKFEHAKTFIAGIIVENPVLVGLLGMCPTLATTKSVEAALGMGILVILTLLGSNLLVSLLRNIIPAEVKIPCYIVIIATFVSVIEMLCQALVPALFETLGVFISLIVVKYLGGYSGIKLFNISHAGVVSKYSIKSALSIFSSSLVNNVGAF